MWGLAWRIYSKSELWEAAREILDATVEEAARGFGEPRLDTEFDREGGREAVRGPNV